MKKVFLFLVWCFIAPSVLAQQTYEDVLREAKQGDATAQEKCGDMFRDKDHIEAIKWYHRAAVQGSVSAMVKCGNLYKNAGGLLADHEKAYKWYHKASEKGSFEGSYQLGEMYEYGSKDMYLLKDDEEALKWYRKSAEQGDPYHQYLVGKQFHYRKKYTEAFKWHQEAAKQDYSDAQIAVAFMYEKGEGVPKDRQEAMKWLRKAAELGNSHGQYVLGFRYEEEGNMKDAIYWYSQAMENSNPAKYQMAVIYYEGRYVSKDNEEAIRLLKELKKEGYRDASSFLSKIQGELAATQSNNSEFAKVLVSENARVKVERASSASVFIYTRDSQDEGGYYMSTITRAKDNKVLKSFGREEVRKDNVIYVGESNFPVVVTVEYVSKGKMVKASVYLTDAAVIDVVRY